MTFLYNLYPEISASPRFPDDAVCREGAGLDLHNRLRRFWASPGTRMPVDPMASEPFPPQPWTIRDPYHCLPEKDGDSWEKVNNTVQKHDSAMCKGWTEEIDTLLVLAGLLTAIVTSFTIQSYPLLRAQPEDLSVQLLYHISLQLNNSATPPATNPTNSTSFVPSTQVVRINSLWFLSISLSLSAAVLGLLCKQWLREYQRDASVSPQDALILRQMRFGEFERWKLPAILASLPVLLEISLLLFFVGILDLLWSLSSVVAALVSLVVGAVFTIVFATTILPTISILFSSKDRLTEDGKLQHSPLGPFKSPQAWVFFRLANFILQRFPHCDTWISVETRIVLDTTLHRWEGMEWCPRDIFLKQGIKWVTETFGHTTPMIKDVLHCLSECEKSGQIEVQDTKDIVPEAPGCIWDGSPWLEEDAWRIRLVFPYLSQDAAVKCFYVELLLRHINSSTTYEPPTGELAGVPPLWLLYSRVFGADACFGEDLSHQIIVSLEHFIHSGHAAPQSLEYLWQIIHSHHRHPLPKKIQDAVMNTPPAFSSWLYRTHNKARRLDGLRRTARWLCQVLENVRSPFIVALFKEVEHCRLVFGIDETALSSKDDSVLSVQWLEARNRLCNIGSISPSHFDEDHDPVLESEKRLQACSVCSGRKSNAKSEDEFSARMAPFSSNLRPNVLAQMLEAKSLPTLEFLGGATGLLEGLGSDRRSGIATGILSQMSNPPNSTEDSPVKDTSTLHDQARHNPAFFAKIDDRRRVYGANVLPRPPSGTILQSLSVAVKDRILILLAVVAVVSLALGLYDDLALSENTRESRVRWVQGFAIVIVILVITFVQCLSDWEDRRHTESLNRQKAQQKVKVLRDGTKSLLDNKEIVVGDIVIIGPGDLVACDGVLLTAHSMQCDESSITGEPQAIKKITFDDCMDLRTTRSDYDGSAIGGNDSNSADMDSDCFVISGSRVLEGEGKYVVVAVGTLSFSGRNIRSLHTMREKPSLRLRLNSLLHVITRWAIMGALLLFTALMIRYFVWLGMGKLLKNEKISNFVDLVIISTTFLAIAIPAALPAAVIVALLATVKRMSYERLSVRVVGSCDTLGKISVICTDKTGTLTQNKMTVVRGSIGVYTQFIRDIDEYQHSTAKDSTSDIPKSTDLVDMSRLNTLLSPQLRQLFRDAITLKSTAFENLNKAPGQPTMVGNQTEAALRTFANDQQWLNGDDTCHDDDVIQMIPFSSNRKAMAVVVPLRNGRFRVYLKGASEILSEVCVSYVTTHGEPSMEKAGNLIEGIQISPMNGDARQDVNQIISSYAGQALRTIVLCYRDFDLWPPAGTNPDYQQKVSFEDLAQNLILISIVGIKDALREGVREALTGCQRAGVAVKMCTGDNVLTARSIALQCGIFTPGGIIMEGPVLARSSAEDKMFLVDTLKAIGEMVAVTGDGNDVPALQNSHVGFSMGVSGTEVAKEVSDVILGGDDFASIVKAIIWGRSVTDSVRKILQLQLSTNATAAAVTFISGIASTKGPVLSVTQLMWTNVFMGALSATAYMTELPSRSLLDHKPYRTAVPLFTVHTFMQIIFQSIYQILTILLLFFLGHKIPTLQSGDYRGSNLQTCIFNVFAFSLIFNSLNCRLVDTHLNIFEGIIRNWYFLAIITLEISLQVIIIFYGNAAFQTTRTGGLEWGLSIGLAVMSLPLGALIRGMPSESFEGIFRRLGLFGKPQVLPTAVDAWESAGSMVRGNLGTFPHVRGGRMRSSQGLLNLSTFANKGGGRMRPAQGRQDPLRVSSLMTMIPTLVASGITQSARTQANLSSAFQMHPDTDRDDPIYRKFILNRGSEHRHLQ